MPRRLLWVFACTAMGCESPGERLELGPLTSSVFTIAPVAAPVPVTPPNLGTCPTGWGRRALANQDAPTACEPWGANEVPQCPEGEVRFVGDATCARLGPPCPSGDFADGLPASNVRYVKPGAAPGGDGSLARPFESISTALTGAPPGATVALAKGTYDAEARVPAGVTLRGACVSGTILAPTAPQALIGVVTSLAAGARVENLTLRGDRPGAVSGVRGASLALQDVEILSTNLAGVVAAQSNAVTLERVSIRGVRIQGTTSGSGLSAESGGTMTGSKVFVDGVVGDAIYATGAGSSIVLSDVALVRGAPLANGTLGDGVVATRSARVALTRYAIEQNRVAGAYAQLEGTISLTLGVVRGTLPQQNTLGVGQAMAARGSGHLEATQSLFQANHSFGVFVSDLGSTARLTDVVIDDTRAEARSQGGGLGVLVLPGARVDATRVHVQRSRAYGVFVHGQGARLVGSDVTVLDTLGQDGDGLGGDGVVVNARGQLELTRAFLSRNRGSGLAVGEASTTAIIEDLIVTQTISGVDPLAVSGVFVQDDALLSLRRARLEGNQLLGLVAIAAVVDAEDLTVNDTQGQQGNGPVGRGVQVQAGAVVTIRRGHFEGNREAGLAVINPGSQLTLEDGVVANTLRRACVPNCPDEGGTGVAALDGAHVSVSRFFVTGNVSCGVELGDDGVGDLRDGVVQSNAIGACVSTSGFDVARISNGVDYFQNQTTLSADYVPLPTFVVTPGAGPNP